MYELHTSPVFVTTKAVWNRQLARADTSVLICCTLLLVSNATEFTQCSAVRSGVLWHVIVSHHGPVSSALACAHDSTNPGKLSNASYAFFLNRLIDT